MPLEFTINQRVGFVQKFVRNVQGIMDDELLRAAVELEQSSPVATGELKKSWDVEPSQFSNGSVIQGRIVNKAPNAFFRIRGRNAGNMSPVSAIRAWLVAVGGDPKAAYPIARSIGKRGTRRYREGKNNAGIDRDGKVLPSSPITRAQKAIARRLRLIRF